MMVARKIKATAPAIAPCLPNMGIVLPIEITTLDQYWISTLEISVRMTTGLWDQNSVYP